MIHTFALLVKRPDMSFEAFSHYWRHEHIPSVRAQLLAAGLSPDSEVPEFGYIQNHRLEMAGLASPYSGYSDFWLASAADWQTKRTSRRVAVGTAEEPRFLAAFADWYAAEDRIVIEEREVGECIKVLRLLTRRTGLSRPDFAQWLGGEHAREISRLPGIVRYEQHPMLDACYDFAQPRYDAFETLWLRLLPPEFDRNEASVLARTAESLAVTPHVLQPRTGPETSEIRAA